LISCENQFLWIEIKGGVLASERLPAPPAAFRSPNVIAMMPPIVIIENTLQLAPHGAPALPPTLALSSWRKSQEEHGHHLWYLVG
jgi:hypothetical protein